MISTFYIKAAIITGFAWSFASCSPVSRLTGAKKVPREYSMNYCAGDIKAPRNDLNREPWVVFSDRDRNPFFYRAGGKVKAGEAGFSDPFLVIKRKGEYLRLIKYTPEVVKNGKFDRKQAEYCGWMPQSRLLLNRQSETDIATGRKNKMLAVLSDTLFIDGPGDYLGTDSIQTFRDPGMTAGYKTVALYDVVYRLKQVEDGSGILLSKAPIVDIDDPGGNILGWADCSMIKDIGTGLHVDTRTLPAGSLQLHGRYGAETETNEDIRSDIAGQITMENKTVNYNPVFSYSVNDTAAIFNTRMLLPIFDPDNNSIYNVKGQPILYKDFLNICKDLGNINIFFVVEGNETALSYLPRIVNALQNLQPLFDGPGDFSYRFGSVLNFKEGNSPGLFFTEPVADYSAFINTLSAVVDKKDMLSPADSPHPWAALRKALEITDNYSDETNLIVLIGEKGYSNANPDQEITGRLSRNNCRIAGFQLYAGGGNIYNNFVLAIEQMIESYAKAMLQARQDILVSPGQVRHENFFAETEEYKNTFQLDFPGNSITEGLICFPQKNEYLSLDILTTNIDTILARIREDNAGVASHMQQAFRVSGNNRTRFDNLYAGNFGIGPGRMPTKKLLSLFKDKTPGWYMSSENIVLGNSERKQVGYYLLLSEGELDELKEFTGSLSAIEVDLKYSTPEKKKSARKVCNCPEDDLFTVVKGQAPTDDAFHPGYAPTGKIRRNIYRQYMRALKYCKPCREKGDELKSLTLAQAHYRITGAPTSTEFLETLKIKDIKNRTVLTDATLDELVSYFKEKTGELAKAERFTSNGEVYYYVDCKLLP